MKTINLLLFPALAVLLLCCKSDTNGPSNTDSFSVNITVKNTAGNPASGLRISWWNKLPDNVLLGSAYKTGATEKTLSTSSIRFDVPHAARITFTVHDWDNSPVAELIDHEILPAGVHLVQWSIHLSKPTRVFNYRLIVQDTATGALIFRDSLNVVLFQPDREISVGGWTSSTGMFQTGDSLLFPNVLALPPLVHTSSEGPDIIGTFSFSDTLIFALTDTATNLHAVYQGLVKKGVANDIQLTWDPIIAKRSDPTILRSRRPATTMDIVPGTLPTQWRLYQNYPNPFN
jgi:hypothetical protein